MKECSMVKREWKLRKVYDLTLFETGSDEHR